MDRGEHVGQAESTETEPEVRADALVLFGATGDLARKKLFSSLYHLTAAGGLDLPVVGVALSEWNDAEFRAHARRAIDATVPEPAGRSLISCCARLFLIGGDYADRSDIPAAAQEPGPVRVQQSGVLPGDPPEPVPHRGRGPLR